MNNIPKDIIRLIGFYVDTDEAIKLRFSNKYFAQIIDEYFLKLYWEIHCPDKFKLYYKKHPSSIENINYIRRYKKIKLLIVQNEFLEKILKLWDICIYNFTTLNITGNFILFSFKPHETWNIIVEIYIYVGDFLRDRYYTSFHDMFLDILHDKYVTTIEDISSLENKKLINAKIFLNNGNRNWSVSFPIDKIIF